MSALLSINDNKLALLQAGQTNTSQGYAWLKQGEVYFDLDHANNPVAVCRLEPQQINNRYWQQCEQSALPENSSGMRHAADLIWKHLAELRQRFAFDQLIFAVPSHYQSVNLQLLVGIAESCGIEVSALVNRAVFTATQYASSAENLMHIDVQLHQTVCSQIVAADSARRLEQVDVLHEVGVHAMQDALLKAIQERFIQSDRFDPLHYAETEQQLFNQLTDLASAIEQQGKANIAVEYAGKQHTCSIDARQWHSALQSSIDVLKQIGQQAGVEQILIDFNGFAVFSADLIDATSVSVVDLSEASLAELLNKARDTQGALIYQTELALTQTTGVSSKSANTDKPVATEQAAKADTASLASAPVTPLASNGATHLLCNGTAVALADAVVSFANNQFHLERQLGSGNLESLMQSGQLFVMGNAQDAGLKINDRLGSNMADGIATVIRVE